MVRLQRMAGDLFDLAIDVADDGAEACGFLTEIDFAGMLLL